MSQSAIVRAALSCTALGAALMITSTTNAQTVAPPTNAAQAQTLVVNELKQIRLVLENANHDYDGHRAAAVHEVTKAIHAFVPPGAKKGAKKGVAAPKKTGNTEPQSVSDAQLAQAIKALQAVQSQIGTNPTGSAAVASSALTKAIEELNLALQVK